MIRVGHGYDVHASIPGESVVLGGMTIPCSFSLSAHSDGDVILHALCDAILGACALGDIGEHFPDDDPAYEDISSRVLLKDVVKKMTESGYVFVNADITVVAQAPKMKPYFNAICKLISEDIVTDVGNINIKATTTEGLGYIGKEQGIAAHAVVLIKRSTD